MKIRSRNGNFDILVRHRECCRLFVASKINFKGERLAGLVIFVLVFVRICGIFRSCDRYSITESNCENTDGTVIFRHIAVGSFVTDTDIEGVFHSVHSAGRVKVVQKLRIRSSPKHNTRASSCRNSNIFCKIVTRSSLIVISNDAAGIRTSTAKRQRSEAGTTRYRTITIRTDYAAVVKTFVARRR